MAGAVAWLRLAVQPAVASVPQRQDTPGAAVSRETVLVTRGLRTVCGAMVFDLHCSEPGRFQIWV